MLSPMPTWPLPNRDCPVSFTALLSSVRVSLLHLPLASLFLPLCSPCLPPMSARPPQGVSLTVWHYEFFPPIISIQTRTQMPPVLPPPRGMRESGPPGPALSTEQHLVAHGPDSVSGTASDLMLHLPPPLLTSNTLDWQNGLPTPVTTPSRSLLLSLALGRALLPLCPVLSTPSC